ncbi:hypothetical protein DFH09DRAFT_1364371 [Mycena vulgaris]|nr:hypothetical protein DFH09DRAFT_1364371 [Mycena vulgaris]
MSLCFLLSFALNGCKNAEEFLGFFLDRPEELIALAPVVLEAQEPPEAQNGWLEVGRKNRAAVTRTIRPLPRPFHLIRVADPGWWDGQIKKAKSPISRIFGGKSRSTLHAAGQKDSVIIEAWRALRLDIQRDAIHTIQDALSIVHPQVVQIRAADASLRILIAALLPALVLHVKRFY